KTLFQMEKRKNLSKCRLHQRIIYGDLAGIELSILWKFLNSRWICSLWNKDYGLFVLMPDHLGGRGIQYDNEPSKRFADV
ncbi:Hypothetical protein FKW44_003643, partial [Caligus rogercresseyi]